MPLKRPKSLPVIVFFGGLTVFFLCLAFLPWENQSKPSSSQPSKSARLQPITSATLTAGITTIFPAKQVSPGIQPAQEQATQELTIFLPQSLEDVPPGPLRDQLSQLTPQARSRALAKLQKLELPINNLAQVKIHSSGMIRLECLRLPPSEGLSLSNQAPTPPYPTQAATGTSIPSSNPPVYNSLPNAPFAIVLNFSGGLVQNTYWNSSANPSFRYLPYSSDGDYTMFSPTEQEFIQKVWQTTAELYAPFQVNVTTAPLPAGPSTVIVAITRSLDSVGQPLPANNAAGVAYMGVVGEEDMLQAMPAFVYHREGDLPGVTAGVTAHEVGHLFGLSHDGVSNSVYYTGHRVGENDWWFPVMGAGYYGNARWSNGEYYDANNPQDDLAIISSHIPFVNVEYDYPTQNGRVALGALTQTLQVDGLAHPTALPDFTLIPQTPYITIRIKPYQIFHNEYFRIQMYDPQLRLTNLSSNTVSSFNTKEHTNLLADGTINTTAVVTPGQTYRIQLLPASKGNPLANPPLGFTAYANMGTFLMTLTPSAIPPPPSPTPTPSNPDNPNNPNQPDTQLNPPSNIKVVMRSGDTKRNTTARIQGDQLELSGNLKGVGKIKISETILPVADGTWRAKINERNRNQVIRGKLTITSDGLKGNLTVKQNGNTSKVRIR